LIIKSKHWINFKENWYKINWPFVKKPAGIKLEIDYRFFSSLFLYLALIFKLIYYIAEYASTQETSGPSFPFALLCFCMSLICLSMMVVLWASIESKVKHNAIVYYLLLAIEIVYVIIQIVFFIFFTIFFIIIYAIPQTRPGLVFVVVVYILFLLTNYVILGLGFIIFGIANTAAICVSETGKDKIILPLKLKVFFN
jgi:hypothetical protein